MRAGHFKQSYAELVALTDSGPVKAWTIVLLAACVALPWVAGAYTLTLATTILITAIGVVGLNLLTGVCGLISLGHAGFLAIGAYTAGILAVDLHVPILPGMVGGGLLAAALSLLVGIPSLRLKGLYLAITTLAFTIIITHAILNLDSLTRGSAGMSLPASNVLGIPLTSKVSFYYFSLAMCVLFVLAALNIMRSRIGRAFAAIRDHDTAAEMMGINLVAYKLMAFAISAFFTGAAGALSAYQVRYINVDSFAVLVSIEALAMIIVGGLGSIAGAILGTVFMALLPEFTRGLFDAVGGGVTEVFSTRALEVRGLIYGVVIMVVLRLQPDGLMGIWRDASRIWRNWPFRY
ncbi:MAG: branched-chain amino acid ABC transporter permease [Pseudomonadota bacterium]|jgi:branched-chain amino acid transport system permease protein